MKPEEINRVIAEFMGGPYFGDACVDAADMAQLKGCTHGLDYCKEDHVCRVCEKEIKDYYLSLDALVPVWEKLALDQDIVFQPLYDAEEAELYWKMYFDSQKISITCVSIQEAAALATAKAIIELTGKQEREE